MAIKELLKQIAAKLPEDSGDVKALLADAIREADDVLDSLSAANKESATRKAKIRDLESQLESARDDLEKAKSNDNKAELERLRKIEASYLESQKQAEAKVINEWKEKAKSLVVDKTSKLYEKVEKVKGRFVFPEEGKEISLEDAKRNLDAYSLLEDTGFFATEQKETGGNPAIKGGDDIPTTSGDALLKLSKR